MYFNEIYVMYFIFDIRPNRIFNIMAEQAKYRIHTKYLVYPYLHISKCLKRVILLNFVECFSFRQSLTR